jgi:hypothetical protein
MLCNKSFIGGKFDGRIILRCIFSVFRKSIRKIESRTSFNSIYCEDVISKSRMFGAL